MKVKLVSIVMLALSNFAMASECEEQLVNAHSEEKRALEFEIETSRSISEIMELAKSEKNADLICKKAKLNLDSNRKSFEHYKLEYKFTLKGSKVCPAQLAQMNKERLELLKEQLKARKEHHTKMSKFITLKCK